METITLPSLPIRKVQHKHSNTQSGVLLKYKSKGIELPRSYRSRQDDILDKHPMKYNSISLRQIEKSNVLEAESKMTFKHKVKENKSRFRSVSENKLEPISVASRIDQLKQRKMNKI